jgi:4-hydroxy-tetrahydrodipicolinate reductase
MVTPGALRLAILGTGRMGREVEASARSHSMEVTAHLGRRALGDPESARAALRDADVAIEFTAPDAAVSNIDLCLEAECPVVVGTTGWYDDLEDVSARVIRRGGGLLWAPNFSSGIAVMKALCARAGEILRGIDDFDVHLSETHHATKKDAPSGTALLLRDTLHEAVKREVEITSMRIGHVPGRHEVWIDGPYEHVVLTHETRSRRVFADGALRAAAWLRGRTGVFTMDHVITLERP